MSRRVRLARIGTVAGSLASGVAAVAAITGGFVIAADPLYFSAHRLLPPPIAAAVADDAISECIHHHAAAIVVVLAAAAAGCAPAIRPAGPSFDGTR